MKKYRDRYKRNEAFLGTIIDTVGGIFSGIIGANKAKKQAKAQAEAARIQTENQQAAINQQMANQQAQIDANYEQQLAQVKAQEELNKEQNQLAAQKIGIQDAQSLTQVYGNQAELNNEFKNRFAKFGGKFKCGGRKKAKLGWGDASGIIGGIGSVITSAMTPASSTPAFKLDYSDRLKYHDPVVADLEVDKSIAKGYTGKQAGQNTAQYAGVNTINNNTTANTMQQRFKNGGKIVYRNRYKRLK